MYINVLVELSSFNIDKVFTYHVNDDLKDLINIGIRVRVPFSNQTLEGFVLDINVNYEDDYEVKDIIDIIDYEPILNNELLELGKWLSKETISTLISSYQVMLPSTLKANNSGKKTNIKYEYIIRINNLNTKLTTKQLEIIDYIYNHKDPLYSELKKINNSVDTLLKNNVLIKEEKEVYRLDNNSNLEDKKILTEDQEKVVNSVDLNKHDTYLLHGVTGSGKTEVYMELIERCINNKKTCILLVPEITLTNQILMRFKKRFTRIAVFHSALSNAEKYDEYRKIVRGEVDIVIGARSAIFAPLNNLGLIIIDECHTDSYKQDNMPKYDAIDVAIHRGITNNFPIVLGSATPKVTQYARATRNVYKLLELKNRVGKAKLPKITLCDMLKEKKIENSCFTETLYKKIKEKLELNEQIILLINRRGYASSLMCNNCGNVINCPNCDIPLTFHKNTELLRCHYCGYANRKIYKCPHCNNDLVETGTGTEKVEEEIKKLFTDKVIRMDIDTTTKKGSHDKIIKAFQNHEYDILLGTQMIAKGLDFPNVTLVGVINADTALYIPSFFSPENTFDLLMQVAGRSGRSEKSGEVIIQTYNKEHYAINYAKNNDYLGFYNEEMKIRNLCHYPPYYFLVNLVVKCKDYDLLSSEVTKISNVLRGKLINSEILGPTPAVPFKINNICRFNILIKYRKEDNLYLILNKLINYYKSNNKIRLEIDFNPNNI